MEMQMWMWQQQEAMVVVGGAGEGVAVVVELGGSCWSRLGGGGAAMSPCAGTKRLLEV